MAVLAASLGFSAPLQLSSICLSWCFLLVRGCTEPSVTRGGGGGAVLADWITTVAVDWLPSIAFDPGLLKPMLTVTPVGRSPVLAIGIVTIWLVWPAVKFKTWFTAV